MHTGITLGAGTIYVSDGDEIKEIGTIASGEVTEIEPVEYAEEIINLHNKTVSLTIAPTYKKWYRKKKGNRYVFDYEIKKGFDPKIMKMLTMEKYKDKKEVKEVKNLLDEVVAMSFCVPKEFIKESE